ncbi:hypothetical protein RFI_20368 [Reticulomyxa filosa]|uniref:Uncharacterized protein n=1 Tax=Reticulomyxa filosa TaxID=46433 RepID=X6MT22_RETFI|nr:hypothetical protein RFI_20368 [Reticulomyxa filosa]|eukprot:ETO16969.1 hypothetical protein RFI_20368 [Reticulomyxa filosa]
MQFKNLFFFFKKKKKNERSQGMTPVGLDDVLDLKDDNQSEIMDAQEILQEINITPIASSLLIGAISEVGQLNRRATENAPSPPKKTQITNTKTSTDLLTGPKSPTRLFSKRKSSPLPVRNESETLFRFDRIILGTDNLPKIKENVCDVIHELTILMIGESRTGKTSLVKRFVAGGFNGKYKRSVGFKEYHCDCIVPIELHERTLADTNMDTDNALDTDHVLDMSDHLDAKRQSISEQISNDLSKDDLQQLLTLANFHEGQALLDSSDDEAEAGPGRHNTNNPSVSLLSYIIQFKNKRNSQ